MNTSAEAAKKLQEALKSVKEAQQILDNLIAPHDYMDVASLVTQASAALLEGASEFMAKNDTEALTKIEEAEDLVDSVYDIIDGDLDEA